MEWFTWILLIVMAGSLLWLLIGPFIIEGWRLEKEFEDEMSAADQLSDWRRAQDELRHARSQSLDAWQEEFDLLLPPDQRKPKNTSVR